MTEVSIARRGYSVAPGYVYVGRGIKAPRNCQPNGHGYFGNPFRLPRNPTPAQVRECLAEYATDLHYRLESEWEADPHFEVNVRALKGQILLCWCVRDWNTDMPIAPGEVRCHAQLLALHAEGLPWRHLV